MWEEEIVIRVLKESKKKEMGIDIENKRPVKVFSSLVKMPWSTSGVYF